MSSAATSWDVARREVDRACALLIDPTPSNLDRCAAILGATISGLSACRPSLAEACSLALSVSRARHLLETAAAWHWQWKQTVCALTAAGYTADGDFAPPSPQRTVCFEA